MPNPFTPAQREALRLMVGISPETHPWLFLHTYAIEPLEDDWYPLWYEINNPTHIRFTGPCPLTGGAEADDVWLAPLMRWLVSVDRAHGVGPSFHKEPERAWAANFYHGCFPEYGATATSALLHSCRAAGVPEVCAIFDMGEEK